MCLLPLEFEPIAKRDIIIEPRIACRDPIALHTPPSKRLPPMDQLPMEIFIEPRIACM